MAQSPKCLLVGSIEAYSGKSGIILGIAHQLQAKGLAVSYGKPVGTWIQEGTADRIDPDVQVISQSLGLSNDRILSPLICLDRDTIDKRLQGEDTTDYLQVLCQALQQLTGDVIVLESPGTLWEGNLFNLSAAQMAGAIAASILIVARYSSALVVDSLLKAKHDFGDRLLGVLINDVPAEQIEEMQNQVIPFLERQGIAVLGVLPSSSLLRSVSVREIAQQLGAEVICRRDRLDLMVESLMIGAMNVNSALEYFRQGQNKAVVTGGDRTDLQLAALETSTSCLILTGHLPPQPLIVSRAEDLEVPILCVDLDTLSTVEIVDRAFGKVRLQEQIKVEFIQQLIQEYFDLGRLIDKLGLPVLNSEL